MAAGKEFATKDIRNVVVVGHGGSGKTSLIDALAFVSGTSKRHGKVQDGVALTWFRPEEKERGISMYVTPAFAIWEDTKINLLDTPGYLDFFGDTMAGIRVADSALVTVGANTGVEVGTEQVWAAVEKRNLPRMVFIAMMDKDTADFEGVLADVQDRLSRKCLAVEIPIGSGDDFKGIVNLVSGKAHMYESGTVKGEYEITDVPDDLKDQVESMRTELLETVATADEALMERYLEGEEISREDWLVAFRTAVLAQEIYPVFCGAAEKTFATRALLHKIVELFPNPAEMPAEIGMAGDEEIVLGADDDKPMTALIFKTTSEAHSGELSLFKVVSGKMTNGDEAENAAGGEEKLAHLSIFNGKDRFEVGTLHAGDIGVVARLKHTHTGDTLCSPTQVVKLAPPNFPASMTRRAIKAKSRNDEDKLGTALNRVHEEDPCFKHTFDSEMGETIVSGLGALHLDAAFKKMKDRYGVELVVSPPKIHYREAIRKEATARGRYKKQTGGKGQFGDCHVRMRPLPRGEGYKFLNKIVGGAIPGKFIPAVDKGIAEAAQKGVIAGYPLVDFEVECFDGSYHAVDSSEMAFKIAGSMAFAKAAEAAKPVLIEPVLKVVVHAPASATGDVMGDITSRRGKVLGMDTQGERAVVEALVPEAEMYEYSSTLRSMTAGRGHHTRTFESYEEVPALAAKKIIEERGVAKETD